MLKLVLAFFAAVPRLLRPHREEHRVPAPTSIDRPDRTDWCTPAVRRAKRAMDGVDLPFVL